MLEPRSASYRPDLDGLRGIAVASVIAYHLAHGALPGGFLGVDVFFVLSGYLIASILWRELKQGTYSIAAFYNRRIRRILPALLLVVLLTAVASFAILLPSDLLGFGRSVFATLGFVANLYFWRDTNYFARAAQEKPLLHLWSLGVEEQFYLLFPLLLAALARWAPRHAFAAMAVLVAVSAGADALALAGGGALPAFYLLPTRAWELGAGALVALAPASTGKGGRGTLLLGWSGAAAVIFALVSAGRPLGASVPAGVLAVAGTVALIHAGRESGNGARRFLSWPPLVWLGLISYSLYLWHWPVIVLSKYFLIRDLTAPEIAGALGFMLLGATLSWRYVERPFRGAAMPIRRVYAAALAGCAVLAALASAILCNAGFPDRLDPDAARLNAAVGTNYRCPVSSYVWFAGSRGCALELPTRNPADADVVLFGNSHAQMYAPLIRDIAREHSATVLLVPMNNCTPTLGFALSAACQSLGERNLDAVANLKRARVVVLATTWGEGGGQFLDGLDRAIARLEAAGKHVVLVGPIAAPNWDLPSEASRSLAFGRPMDRPFYLERSRFDEQFAPALARFGGRQDLEWVRPDQAQCDAQRCLFVVEGHSLFADGNHLAAAELSRFRGVFEPALRKALGP